MIDWDSFWIGVGVTCAVIFTISALVFWALTRNAPVVDEHEEVISR